MEAYKISQQLHATAQSLISGLTDNEPSVTTGYQRELLTGIVALRGANREAWLSSRAVKATTSDAKTEIDRLNLELQGLYYEQRHLQTEIQACKDTPTIYDQVDLISEAEFCEIQPETRSISSQDLMRARLQHEKTARLRLEGTRSELSAKKAALQAENKKRKQDLENLEQQLIAFVSVQIIKDPADNSLLRTSRASSRNTSNWL